MHQSPLGPPRTARAHLRWRLAAAACAAVLLAGAATVAAAAVVQAAPASTAAALAAKTTTALTANWYESAPYYSTLDSDAPDLAR